MARAAVATPLCAHVRGRRRRPPAGRAGAVAATYRMGRLSTPAAAHSTPHPSPHPASLPTVCFIIKLKLARDGALCKGAQYAGG